MEIASGSGVSSETLEKEKVTNGSNDSKSKVPRKNRSSSSEGDSDSTTRSRKKRKKSRSVKHIFFSWLRLLDVEIPPVIPSFSQVHHTIHCQSSVGFYTDYIYPDLICLSRSTCVCNESIFKLNISSFLLYKSGLIYFAVLVLE